MISQPADEPPKRTRQMHFDPKRRTPRRLAAVPNRARSLRLPDVTGKPPPKAALGYANADFPVLPVAFGKHPGSIVGKGWPMQSSTDPATIRRRWREHPDAGIAIHTGAAGLTFFDVDRDDVPDELAWLRTGIVQFSRAADVGSERGHYGFDTGDEIFVSGDLKLEDGTKVGEIRSGNTVIIAAPSPHVHAETKNGEYRWRTADIGRTIPKLPSEARKYLRPIGPKRSSLDGTSGTAGFAVEATNAAVKTATREWCENAQPKKLDALVHWIETAEDSTRNSTRDALRIAASEARIGLYPLAEARGRLREAMLASYRLRDELDKFDGGGFERLVANGVGYALSRHPSEIEEETNRNDSLLSDDKGEHSKKRSQASMIVDLALEHFRLGISTDSKPFGYQADTPHVALDLRGGKLGLRQTLSRDFFRKYNAAPTPAAISAACGVLEGMAREIAPVDLNLRVASDAKAVYLDLADAANRVVKIEGGTWEVTAGAPHMFRRTELTAPMPDPVRGGNLDRLWKHINVKKDDQALLLAVLVDALLKPSSPKPTVAFTGVHGTAKTGTSVRFISLIDPSAVPLHSPPKDLEHWLSSAAGSWVVGLDNLSSIPDWLSDALCRASTGSGSVKRALWTDDSLSVVTFRRCVVLNGIDFGGIRGDLADRLVPFELEQITHRLADEELNQAWSADWPVIFGGLLDMAAEVHALIPELPPSTSLPRMADFAKVLLAVDKIKGTDGMARYTDRLARAMADSAMSSPFIEHLIDEKYHTGKAGLTAGEILIEVNRARSGLSAPQGWPKSAKTVTALLKRNAPALRSMGWRIENDGGANKACVTKWFIHTEGVKSPEKPPKAAQAGETGREAKRPDLRRQGTRQGRRSAKKRL